MVPADRFQYQHNLNIDSHIYSFQYRLITCYVLLLISLTVFAQSGKERFSGQTLS